MNSLLIRADAGLNIGAGHFMRCLALAMAWKKRVSPSQVSFVSRNLPKAFKGQLADHKIGLIEIPENIDSSIDADLLIESSKREGAVVIVDGYSFRECYLSRLRSSGVRTLYIDDMAQLSPCEADLILNQNAGASAILYRKSAVASRLLLGARFALIREEFNKVSRDTSEPSSDNRLLISLGASDPMHLSRAILKALDDWKEKRLDVRLVLGPLSDDPTLEEFSRSSYHHVVIERSVKQMAELMAWADVGVTAGGITSLEMAYCGLPMIIIPTVENQLLNAEGMASEGCAFSLPFSERPALIEFRSFLSLLFKDELIRRRMGAIGKHMVDGKGSERVVEALRLLKSDSSTAANEIRKQKAYENK